MAAKRAVSVAKGKAYDDLYQRLGTKDGTDRLLVKDDEIRGRWREYFDKLF